ncbi:MAG: hypothetical protein ABJV04_02850 [Aliiglaciecola sp.]|uniref:hypothetical protein n=1 Tax=Aliiglaciecola sp. TaxID=1872441 RepID=UPI00329A0EA0
MRHWIQVLLFTLGFISPSAYADNQDNSISCEYDIISAPLNETHLKDLQKQAVMTSKSLCLGSLRITEDEVGELKLVISTFASLAKEGVLETFPDNKFNGVEAITEQWSKQLLNVGEDTDYVSKLAVNFNAGYVKSNGDIIKDQIRFELPPNHQNDFALEVTSAIHNECKKVDMADNCLDATKQLNAAIEPAFFSFKKALTGQNLAKHNRLVSAWQTYIDESRYQFPWEAIATARWHHEHFSGEKLVGPPPTQVILLHPTLVIEHVHNLEKGNRDDVSVAIEWVGMNWWKKGLGFSITSIYNDRADAKSVGTGITLHFDSTYSIGMVHRSHGANSIFVNVDLLDLFGDKKEKYKKYKKYF